MSFIFSAKRSLTLLVGLLIFSTSFASEHEKEEEFDVTEMIMHHISDAHEWHLWGGHHDAVAVPLPIILIDGGLKVFSSNNFYDGELVHVEGKEGKEASYVKGVGAAAGYAMFEEEVYKLDASGNLNVVKGEVKGADSPLDFSITKNVLSLMIGGFLLLILMFNVARFYRKNGPVAPRGLAKYVEVLIVMVRDDIAKANIDHHKYHKYVPYLLTIFFFIFVNNLTGLIPVLGTGAIGNIAVTLFLAVCTLLVTVLSGNRNYWGHIFAMPGVPWPVLIILIPIELVGILTKPFALMIRLFANMTAGHIIILALISIIFINKSEVWGALSVPMALFISVLELLVAFLQAFLFAMLSALFIGAAVEEAHH